MSETLLEYAKRFAATENRVGSCYPAPGTVGNLVSMVARVTEQRDRAWRALSQFDRRVAGIWAAEGARDGITESDRAEFDAVVQAKDTP